MRVGRRADGDGVDVLGGEHRVDCGDLRAGRLGQSGGGGRIGVRDVGDLAVAARRDVAAMDLADPPSADDAESHVFLHLRRLFARNSRSSKKEYTFHIDLGMEFLFHSVRRAARPASTPRAQARASRTRGAKPEGENAHGHPCARGSSAARPAYRGPANLAGKIAIVTGGTQGLGEAIARLFAERGAAGIVICGRNSDRGERVAAEISAAGCPTVFVQADLAKVADCRKVVAKADERFGRVDALVNAAALTDRGDIFDTTEERYNEIFDVNVRAPFFLIQETVRIMRREKIAGAIVNIQSMSAPWRAAAHHRLLRIEGRARDPDPQRRPLARSNSASASTASTSAGCRRRARTAS